MLTQLIVASRAQRPGTVRQIALAKPPQFHIKNKVTLKGYVGKDAQSFATRQQNTFVVLSVATKSGYKDKQTQQWVNHTEWHRVVAFGKPADYAKILKKGDYIEIEGKIQHSEYKGVKTDTIRVTSILKLDRAERVAAEDDFDETFDEEVAA